jgi:hypothetical protein
MATHTLRVGNQAGREPGDGQKVTLPQLEIVQSKPEQRQIAKTMDFDAKHAAYIDWNAIALTARELGAHFNVRTSEGAISIVMFWINDDEPSVDNSEPRDVRFPGDEPVDDLSDICPGDAVTR